MVSRKTVSRMSRYRRLLQSLRDDGVENIYSHQLARHAVVSAAQVRRDLMAIGYSGSPNKGYDVAACIESISYFLDGADPTGGRPGRRRQPRARGPLPLRRQEPGRRDRRRVRRRSRAHRHADPRRALPRRLAHGGAHPRTSASRSPCSPCPARPPRRRPTRSCARASRASSASPPRPCACPTRSSSSTWTSRRRSSPPPTSPVSAAARSRRRRATATSNRSSGNWNPCSRGRT